MHNVPDCTLTNTHTHLSPWRRIAAVPQRLRDVLLLQHMLPPAGSDVATLGMTTSSGAGIQSHPDCAARNQKPRRPAH